MSTAFIFPGQGSQKVGMGKDLADAFPTARHVFEEVDEALGQKLSTIMWDGPDTDLTLTENAQPALMAVSLAIMTVLKKDGGFSFDKGQVRFVAGHSLGEYSALAAADALSLSETARLLKLRGQAMQRAVPVGAGAMAALIGLDFDAAAKIAQQAAQGEVCTAANDNAPGQVVISGNAAAIDRAIEIAKDAGAKKAIKLAVSAPFHCALMQPAADEMADALSSTALQQPQVPVVANVTAEAVTDPNTVKKLLVDQVTGAVRWTDSIRAIAKAGVENTVEVGAGKVLTGMVKRIERTLNTGNIETPADIEAFLSQH